MERAIKDTQSRQVFAPYFKARWQNMQNIVNDSVFYTLVKEPYQNYYIAYIRQWLQWATGFVPMLHRGDFFSTGMGYTVCDIFSRECMSGGFRFNSANKELRSFIESWGGSDFNDLLSQMYFFSNAGGNALITLTPVNGEVKIDVVPIDRSIFTIGRRGVVTQATILNRFMSGSLSYYAKEERINSNGAGYYKVSLADYNSIATSPSWSSSYLQAVPKVISEQWSNVYGTILPNVWYRLPAALHSLGIYNVKNKAVAVALADMPGYSDSSLHTALDILYSIDYNYTQSQMDLYWGRTRVIVPKRMQTKSISSNAILTSDGVSFLEAIQSAPLSEDLFTEVPNENSVEGDPIKPFFMQPDLRGESHKYIRDAELELLAAKVGLSSTTLANHLSYNTSKTATEFRGEQDTTEVSVGRKRELASKAINAMLSDVAVFYGYSDKITISWNKPGVNAAGENADLLADYQAGTLPLKQYLKKRWHDLSEEEIEKWSIDIKSQESERRAAEFGSNIFEDKVITSE